MVSVRMWTATSLRLQPGVLDGFFSLADKSAVGTINRPLQNLIWSHDESGTYRPFASLRVTTHIVMLSEAKHLFAHRERPFASLRVTLLNASCQVMHRSDKAVHWRMDNARADLAYAWQAMSNTSVDDRQ